MRNLLTLSQKDALHIYDDGGKTIDCYTVVFLNEPISPSTYAALGMSSRPFHPQGVCQHTEAKDGRHLGKRILFEQLPTDCQIAVEQDFQAA